MSVRDLIIWFCHTGSEISLIWLTLGITPGGYAPLHRTSFNLISLMYLVRRSPSLVVGSGGCASLYISFCTTYCSLPSRVSLYIEYHKKTVYQKKICILFFVSSLCSMHLVNKYTVVWSYFIFLYLSWISSHSANKYVYFSFLVFFCGLFIGCLFLFHIPSYSIYLSCLFNFTA